MVTVLVLTGIFCGCQGGDGEGEAPDTPTPAPPAYKPNPKPVPVYSGLTVTPGTVMVKKGGYQQFTADNSSGTVTWTILGDKAEGTAISAGLLKVAEDETVKELTIEAALSDKTATVYALIIGNEGDHEKNGLTVSPSTVLLAQGEQQTFTAELDDGGAAENVAWSVTSGVDTAYPVPNGVLTVAVGESAEKLTVTASQGTLSGTALVIVPGNEAEPVPVNYGVRVKPQTASVLKGKTVSFEAYTSASASGSKITSGLSWAVFGGGEGTTITADDDGAGALTVSAEESAVHLTVRAKSDDGSYGTAVVKLSAPGMAEIPGGSFERTVSGKNYTITLSPFLIGSCEVTQKEWTDMMGSDNNLSQFKGDDHPVERVTWYNALRYCNKLSKYEDLDPVYEIGDGDAPMVEADFAKNGYRLPTEAEWEYAARGGQNYSYAGSNTPDDVAWYSGNSGKKTHPVGEKLPNGYGLYDMNGNVWEWCWDWEAAYAGEDETDPTGPESGTERVNRGGAWDRAGKDTVSSRQSDEPTYNWLATIGFRVVRRPSAN
jgi:formylglycine-generating enzyme required for sulfatase activity